MENISCLSECNIEVWENESERITHLKDVGELLRSQNCGGFIESSSSQGHVFLHRVPNSPFVPSLLSGVVVVDNSRFLRDMCERTEQSFGRNNRWTCKTKGTGRLFAACSHSGCAPKAKGSGIRIRVSQKVNCSAFVKTKRISSISCDLAYQIEREISRQSGTAMQDISLAVVAECNFTHSGHDCLAIDNDGIILKRTKDILEIDVLRNCILEFIGISNTNRGRILSMQQFVSARLPEYSIPYKSLKNAVNKLEVGDNDAQMLLDSMKSELANGNIEYLGSQLDDASGVLKTVTWSFKGSKEIVSRCNDLLFWDSTHHVTRYNFKLSTFTVVDSESKSRSVLLSLNLSETAIDFMEAFQCWREAFDLPLPHVVFSDDDVAFRCALNSFSGSGRTHLMCTYHLFDMNVKRHLRSVLGVSGGDAKWKCFRKGLSHCREATTEHEFHRLWKTLLDTWLSDDTESCRRALNYLKDHVWTKRKRWAVCYFKDCFTLGSSSTQRSESWNSLVKSCSTTTSLRAFVDSLKFLFNRQGSVEEKMSSRSSRISPLLQSKLRVPRTIVQFAETKGASNFYCQCIAEELSDAVLMDASRLTERVEGVFVSQVSHVYDQTFVEQAPCTVTIRINAEESFHVICECLYTVRMKIPCRHILSLAFSVDRSAGFGIMSSFTNGGDKTMLELVLANCSGSRWMRTKNVSYNEEALSLTKENDMNASPFEIKRSIVKLPSSTGSGGRRRAYSILLSEFKELASDCTQSSCHLVLGEILRYLSVRTREEILSKSDKMSTAKEVQKDLKSMLISILQEPVENESNEDKLEESYSPRTFEFESLDSSIDFEQGKPPGTVKNPPKRCKRLNLKKSKYTGKNRSARELKTKASRYAPLKLRRDYATVVRAQNKPKSVKYACPFCSKIKVQNNFRNVVVHVTRKHNISNDAAMGMKLSFIEAAANISSQQNQSSIEKRRPPEVKNRYEEDKLDLTDSTSDHEINIRSMNVENRLSALTPDGGNPYQPKKEEKEPSEYVSLHHTIPNSKTTQNLSLNARQIAKVADLQEGCHVQLFSLAKLKWIDGKVMKIEKINNSFFFKHDGEEEYVSGRPNVWRMINRCDPFPVLSVFIHPDYEATFLRTMNYAKNASKTHQRVPFGKGNIFSKDFKVLQPKELLTDEVIACFVLSLNEISRNPNDKRFYFVSPQAIVKLTDSVSGITRWMQGVKLHDIDMLIWPIHSSAYVHWLLCIGFPHSKSAIIVDPYDPVCSKPTTRISQQLYRAVLNGLSQLSHSYDSEYGLPNEWKLTAPASLAKKASFPAQPSHNGTDCGVFVCLYIWSLMTGQSMQQFDQRNITYDVMINNARANIGGLIVAD